MSIRKTVLALFLGLVVLFQLAPSCVSNPDYSGNDGGGYYPDDYQRPRRIPRNADMVREGNDKLKWTADLDGTMYLYDMDDDNIAWTGPVRRGQEVVASPDQDKVWVAGTVVFNKNLERTHRHELYFASNNAGGGRGGRGGGQAPVDQVPDGARRMANGTGNLAINQAPSRGTVWVYDETDLKIVYSTNLGNGNSFQIFPTQNYVNLNSQRHATVRFARGHRYSLYFRQR